MIWKRTGFICLILGWSRIYIAGIGVGFGGGRSLQVDRKMNIKFLDYLLFLLDRHVLWALNITWANQHLVLVSRERGRRNERVESKIESEEEHCLRMNDAVQRTADGRIALDR